MIPINEFRRIRTTRPDTEHVFNGRKEADIISALHAAKEGKEAWIHLHGTDGRDEATIFYPVLPETAIQVLELADEFQRNGGWVGFPQNNFWAPAHYQVQIFEALSLAIMEVAQDRQLARHAARTARLERERRERQERRERKC